MIWFFQRRHDCRIEALLSFNPSRILVFYIDETQWTHGTCEKPHFGSVQLSLDVLNEPLVTQYIISLPLDDTSFSECRRLVSKLSNEVFLVSRPAVTNNFHIYSPHTALVQHLALAWTDAIDSNCILLTLIGYLGNLSFASKAGGSRFPKVKQREIFLLLQTTSRLYPDTVHIKKPSYNL